MRHPVLGAIVFAGLLLSVTVAAAAPPETRVALVIGNGDYGSGRLVNAVLDARSMSETLRALGFDVLALGPPTAWASSTTPATACR